MRISITNDIKKRLKVTTLSSLSAATLHVMSESRGKMTAQMELYFRRYLGWASTLTLRLTQKTPLVSAGRQAAAAENESDKTRDTQLKLGTE